MEKEIILGNGDRMPAVGLGTWQANDAELEAAVNAALEAGYRHIDTATVYENEKIIGKVLKEWIDSGRVTRSDLFIVTKLPPSGSRPEDVDFWIQKSLKDLQISYLDLYLMHVPFAFVKGDDLHPLDEDGNIMLDRSSDYIKVWKEMEKQVENGRTKAIGISNFNIKQISEILKVTKIPVSSLQIELHVYFQQNELVEFCKKNNISVTAYSPLGSRGLVKKIGATEKYPDLLENPTILELCEKYEKTPAQIALRHIVQKGVAVIPKSTNPERLRKNIDIFGWNLADEDIEKLNALDRGAVSRVCTFAFFKGIEKHPHFPF